jgi:hypothetical protein
MIEQFIEMNTVISVVAIAGRRNYMRIASIAVMSWHEHR